MIYFNVFKKTKYAKNEYDNEEMNDENLKPNNININTINNMEDFDNNNNELTLKEKEEYKRIRNTKYEECLFKGKTQMGLDVKITKGDCLRCYRMIDDRRRQVRVMIAQIEENIDYLNHVIIDYELMKKIKTIVICLQLMTKEIKLLSNMF